MTPEAAKELFHCLWINMMQYLQLNLSPTAAAGREGFSHHETVTIGGQTPKARMRPTSCRTSCSNPPGRCTSYPELSARIHANTPERFLHAVVEANKDGKGSPKIINDEYVVPFYLGTASAWPMRSTTRSRAAWNRACPTSRRTRPATRR